MVWLVTSFLGLNRQRWEQCIGSVDPTNVTSSIKFFHWLQQHDSILLWPQYIPQHFFAVTKPISVNYYNHKCHTYHILIVKKSAITCGIATVDQHSCLRNHCHAPVYLRSTTFSAIGWANSIPGRKLSVCTWHKT